jgi:hypothetical protein
MRHAYYTHMQGQHAFAASQQGLVNLNCAIDSKAGEEKGLNSKVYVCKLLPSLSFLIAVILVR